MTDVKEVWIIIHKKSQMENQTLCLLFVYDRWKSLMLLIPELKVIDKSIRMMFQTFFINNQ